MPCPLCAIPLCVQVQAKVSVGTLCSLLMKDTLFTGSLSETAATRDTGSADGRSSHPYQASLPPHLKLRRWTVTHQDAQPRRIMTATRGATWEGGICSASEPSLNICREGNEKQKQNPFFISTDSERVDTVTQIWSADRKCFANTGLNWIICLRLRRLLILLSSKISLKLEVKRNRHIPTHVWWGLGLCHAPKVSQL